MLNVCAGQFSKAVHCKATILLKTEARMGFKTDDLTLKQNMYRQILVFFGDRCSKALNVPFFQIHSNVPFSKFMEKERFPEIISLLCNHSR